AAVGVDPQPAVPVLTPGVEPEYGVAALGVPGPGPAQPHRPAGDGVGPALGVGHPGPHARAVALDDDLARGGGVGGRIDHATLLRTLTGPHATDLEDRPGLQSAQRRGDPAGLIAHVDVDE